MSRSVAIIVPVFNEESSIEPFYDRVDRLGFAESLIFVDNASTDGTITRLEALPKGKVIRHERNRGYGASVRSGFEATDAELLIVMDVDLEFPPEVIPELIEGLEQHRVIYCSRFMAETPNMSLVRRLGNRLVSQLFDLLFRQNTTDLCTGVKALRANAFPLSQLRFDGFEAAIEIAVMFVLAGARIHDVPITYTPRSRDRSKMRHVPEALKFVRHIVGFWLRCIVLGRPLHSGPGRDRRSPSGV
jgi:glycosyltransferase involved in cell wall biosynthesis